MDYRKLRRADRLIRKGWTHERQVVEGDLRHWGPRYRRILMSDGYSSISPFTAALYGASGGFGEKILIPDMTERAWTTNTQVWSLPSDYSWALVARYCLPPTANGQIVDDRAIGDALGIAPDTYRQRVSRARTKLQQKAFVPVTKIRYPHSPWIATP